MGAQAPNGIGLFYQWGDIVGHGVAEGYNFSLENYEAKGLNLISTNLDNAHDAARAYYGPIAKTPSVSQLEELIRNCIVTNEDNNVVIITSRNNGNFIKIRSNGYFQNLAHNAINELRCWSSTRYSDIAAYTVHYENNVLGIFGNARYMGYNIMAVHS